MGMHRGRAPWKVRRYRLPHLRRCDQVKAAHSRVIIASAAALLAAGVSPASADYGRESSACTRMTRTTDGRTRSTTSLPSARAQGGSCRACCRPGPMDGARKVYYSDTMN